MKQFCRSLNCLGNNMILPSRAERISSGSRALRAMSSPDFLKQLQAVAKAVNSAEDERTVQARRARSRQGILQWQYLAVHVVLARPPTWRDLSPKKFRFTDSVPLHRNEAWLAGN